jgi:hypothetical protein
MSVHGNGEPLTPPLVGWLKNVLQDIGSSELVQRADDAETW